MSDRYASLIEEALNRYSDDRELAPVLYESVRYSLLAGGKRVRSCLSLACCELAGGKAEEALPFAAALEMIHTYSLIHDDLPGMDDDPMRRGKPSSHVRFGVGNAVLAGDALLTMAGCLLLEQKGNEKAKQIIFKSALDMASGQSLDLQEQTGELSDLEKLHDLKTGALFKAACLSGALVGGCGDRLYGDLERFSKDLGLLFQMTDDLLDAEQDKRENKLTFVTLLGAKGTKAEIIKLSQKALLDISAYTGAAAQYLNDLVGRITDRAS